MSQNFSTVLTTTPTRIVPAATETRYYIRIDNVNVAGGPSAWISHLVTTPAANIAGSVEVAPGGANREQYNSVQAPYGQSYVPQGEIWGVAASGTVQLTVEVL